MCRALVESPLKARFDADRRIENRLPPGNSLFRKLLEVSKLDDPLKEWADPESRKAAIGAARANPKFEKECENQGRGGRESRWDT
jgi:hypothetical protein